VPEDYVHRIGRTARAGSAGTAIAFCSDEERPYLRDIEKLTRRSIRVLPAPAVRHDPRPAPIDPPPQPPERGKSSRGADAGTRNSDARAHRGQPAAADALPAFLRRRAPAKPAAVSHRGPRPAKLRAGR